MANPYALDIPEQEYGPLQTPPLVGEERFEVLPSDVNQIVEKHNQVQSVVSVKWVIGFDGERCWLPNGEGQPVGYHAASESNPTLRASTVPGTNSAVWRADSIDSDTDFVAAYSAAKA